MQDCIFHALALDGQGGLTRYQSIADVPSAPHPNDPVDWVHLDVNHPETRSRLLAPPLSLPVHIADALLAQETRPQATILPEGVLLFLRGVNTNENAAPEDMVSIRLIITGSRIVSTRMRRLRAVMDILTEFEAGTGPTDVGDLITRLVRNVTERMEPVLASLDDGTDRIEEELLDDASSELRERIVTIRKQAIIFRRYMAPQREAIQSLKTADLPWLGAEERRRLDDSYSRLMRFIEDLDAIRERAQIVKDELANTLSERLNRNTYLLSVIAAIFLPLGFLTGLLGINVGGIPGSDYAVAFWLFCGLLALVVGLQILWFKRQGWF